MRARFANGSPVDRAGVGGANFGWKAARSPAPGAFTTVVVVNAPGHLARTVHHLPALGG
jgi:hypothetical protein